MLNWLKKNLGIQTGLSPKEEFENDLKEIEKLTREFELNNNQQIVPKEQDCLHVEFCKLIIISTQLKTISLNPCLRSWKNLSFIAKELISALLILKKKINSEQIKEIRQSIEKEIIVYQTKLNPVKRFFSLRYYEASESKHFVGKLVYGLFVSSFISVTFLAVFITVITTANIIVKQIEIAQGQDSIDRKMIDATSLIVIVISSGSLGSIISIFVRIDEFDREDINNYNDPSVPILIGLFRPLIGASFSLFAFSLVSTGIIPLDRLVEEPAQNSAQSPKIFFYISISFVAGFSERLGPKLIGQTEKVVIEKLRLLKTPEATKTEATPDTTTELPKSTQTEATPDTTEPQKE